MILTNVVLYDIIQNQPLSYDNQVDSEHYPERINPNYRYLVIYEPYINPNKDKRYYDYNKVETPVLTAHPVYFLYGQWKVEHSYIKRSNADIFLSVENARRLANKTWEDNDLYFIAQGLIQKQLKNITLTQDEENIMLDYVERTNKILQNLQNETNIKSQILSGQEPNIDSGWQIKV